MTGPADPREPRRAAARDGARSLALAAAAAALPLAAVLGAPLPTYARLMIAAAAAYHAAAAGTRALRAPMEAAPSHRAAAELAWIAAAAALILDTMLT